MLGYTIRGQRSKWPIPAEEPQLHEPTILGISGVFVVEGDCVDLKDRYARPPGLPVQCFSEGNCQGADSGCAMPSGTRQLARRKTRVSSFTNLERKAPPPNPTKLMAMANSPTSGIPRAFSWTFGSR